MECLSLLLFIIFFLHFRIIGPFQHFCHQAFVAIFEERMVRKICSNLFVVTANLRVRQKSFQLPRQSVSAIQNDSVSSVVVLSCFHRPKRHTISLLGRWFPRLLSPHKIKSHLSL